MKRIRIVGISALALCACLVRLNLAFAQVEAMSAADARSQENASHIDSIKPTCPAGWGFIITDDKFLPEVRARFGKVDMCFRSDDPRRDKRDAANYTAPSCVAGATGGAAGFVLKVYAGEDRCERESSTMTAFKGQERNQ
ncbi:MAG: hypothetical protein U0174_17820 [Polyangiaceae bacterium]